MPHIVFPPNMGERQMRAIEFIERKAFAYRQSFAGIDHAKRRAAAKKRKA